MKEALLLLVVIALLASLVRETKNRGSDSIAVAVWKYVSYYTVITNMLVCAWFLTIVVWPYSGSGQFFSNANVSAAITFYIVTVGVANYLIYGWQTLPLFERIADTFVHALTPIFTFIYWFLFVDKDGLSLSSIGYWLIYPLGYAIYTICHGPFTRFYPYEFTNVEVFGLKKVLLSTVLLSVAILVGGSAFIFLGQVANV